jgi:hypothetical protein
MKTEYIYMFLSVLVFSSGIGVILGDYEWSIWIMLVVIAVLLMTIYKK